MRRLVLILFFLFTLIETFAFSSICGIYLNSTMAATSAFSVSCERIEAMREIHPAVENDTLPELNREILAFVDSKMKKKVGRGECWDLAAEALNAAGAKWNGKLDFGRKLSAGEEILPGDIIQFEGVKIKIEERNARYTQVLKHHTGIIYSMKGKKQFDMANQNTEEHGKKVSLTTIDLDKITSGKYFIYRPER